MVEPELVRQIRELAARGFGVARGTVRRYLRTGAEAGVQVRPGARRLTAEQAAAALAWFEGAAEANAVVVRDLLRDSGVAVSARTVQRLVEDRRRARRAAELATVRFETAPGQQMQIDFGQKRVQIGGAWVRVCLLAAVLSYSRRLFVKAFLAERGDDWREGIAAAFEHFGGVPATLLGDNARPLVVAFHPAYLAFCRDWGTEPRAVPRAGRRRRARARAGSST